MRLNAHSLHTHTQMLYTLLHFIVARIGESAHQSHQVVNFLFAILQYNVILFRCFISFSNNLCHLMSFYIWIYLETLHRV